MAKGYTQRHGVDYDETFSPVIRYSTIRILLALAAEKQMDIDHMDVKTAFLNGDLSETVFIEQPEGFKIQGSEHKVYKLHKAIYGLKQASKSWYEKINSVLLGKLHFRRLSSEPCVYFKSNGEELLIIGLYVDDIILFSTKNSAMKSEVKKRLMQEFDMKDLGPANHIIGMRITRNEDCIFLDQSNYIKDILERFNMTDCKTAQTPMETGLKLLKADKKEDNLEYRNLIGCLMYVAVCSRPDIAHAVSMLSQFNECYNQQHWKAAKRVLRYLKGTVNHRLVFEKSGLNISGYTDADWASCEIDRRSYTGFVFKIGKSTVSWESRKQRTVALSSTEAEYMALSDSCKEALFIRTLMYELLGNYCSVTMFNDNQSAHKLCKNAMYHARTKHIDVRHHFIREVVNSSIIDLKYLCTSEMTADVLTKPLTKDKHEKFVISLGLHKQTEL